MAHVAAYKKDVVKNIVNLLVEYPIIGSLNMENLPASALQKMRQKLRGKAELTMTKRRIMKVAFAEAEKQKPGISTLVPHLKGMPALMFTKENPFVLYKIIKQAKSPAAAKAGQLAPHDISVKAGPTPFMPGPIIGELGMLGIKTGVEAGKVAIKADKVVAKEGEPINAKVASLLLRLGIEPMELGLDVTAVYENGIIYGKKVLDIDEKQFLADLAKAAASAHALSMEIGYASKDTINELIAKAHRQAKGLGVEANILTPGVIGDIIAKAERQSMGLKQAAKI